MKVCDAIIRKINSIALVGILPTREFSLDGSISFLETTSDFVICASDEGEITFHQLQNDNGMS
jgi:hypothetical protein